MKHGHSTRKKTSSTYSSWKAMKNRCLNLSHKAYNSYGGRGIFICSNWINSFEQFLKDMGERPEGYTLDRINVDGNYEPANCRWATKEVQQMNMVRRKNKTSIYKGVSFNKDKQKWKSCINYNKKQIHIGYFSSEIEAAKSYNEAALKLYGNFVYLNKV